MSEVARVLIGRVIDDRYEVVSRIGSSHMADVFLADDRVLDRQVALKVLAPPVAEDLESCERFRRAASRAAGLDHPNIVRITDLGQAERTTYVAMEYLEGRPLQEIILEYAPFSGGFLTSVSLQILEALRFAHRREVFHGGLRPQNVFVDAEGWVTVTDFGLAQAALEQPVEAAADLRSLGVMMYQMATGISVPDEPAAPRTLNPLIPAGLDAIIIRSLGLGPGKPYLSAQAMLDDLLEVEESGAEMIPEGFAEEAARVMASATATAVAGPLETAPPTTADRRQDQEAPVVEPPEQPGRPRRAWPWVLVTILILALAATAYVMISNRTGTGGPELGTVPEVVGLSEARAITKIQEAGFGYQIGGRQPTLDVKEGDVLRQDTPSGTRLEKGRTIRIWISSGTGQVEVPNVVGLTQEEAVETLRDAGLEVATKPEVHSEVQVGRVLRQNPEAYKRVDPGATVTVTVAAVTNTVRVPPLTGMTQKNAEALLESLDLVADVQATASPLPGGLVDRQDPAGGSEVQPGAAVRIFVSDSPVAKTVLVPAVGALELTEAEAKTILARHGLKAKIIDLETPDFKPGLCIYQEPEAGLEVKLGSEVSITIARKPTTTTTAPPPSGAIRYDQTDTRIVKTGTWTDYRATMAYLGSYGRSNTAGASATIYFTGTRLDWIAMKGTTTGMVDVYVDGAKKTTVNLAAPLPTYAVNVWTTGNLARGSHRVTIVLSRTSPAGKYLTLDAVDIWGAIRNRP